MRRPDLHIDDDNEVLDEVFGDDGNATPRHRSRIFRERDDRSKQPQKDDQEGSDDPRSVQPSTKYPRSDEVMKVLRGDSLSTSVTTNDNKKRDIRENFSLKQVTDPKQRELWKRLFEAVVLDHIQRGPASLIIGAENGCLDQMTTAIKMRYRQMFGTDAPALSIPQIRAVPTFAFRLTLVPKPVLGICREDT